MRNSINNLKGRKIAILVFLTLTLIIAGFLLPESILTTLINYFSDFAEHHYFYLAAIVFFVSLIIVKLTLNRAEKKMLSKEGFVGNDFKSKSKNIENVDLGGVLFSGKDVLEFEEAKENRAKEILLSLRLGLFLRKKVRIFFRDYSSFLKIDDLVVKKNSNFIMLKGGGRIPINRIYKIELAR